MFHFHSISARTAFQLPAFVFVIAGFLEIYLSTVFFFDLCIFVPFFALGWAMTISLVMASHLFDIFTAKFFSF